MSGIRALTYNVKMLPGVAGSGTADLRRAGAILAAIEAARPAYDLVCLQEVFDETVRARLARGFGRRLPHVIEKCSGRGVLQQDSGLFLASRQPIAGHEFEEFEDSAGVHETDFWADKGICGARLDMKGWTLHVFHAHLQSDPGHVGQYRAVRTRQIVQIRRFMGRTLKARGEAALLLGDLNIAGETREYASMLADLGHPRDLFREANPDDPGCTWDGRENRNMIPGHDHDRQRLDYVLAFDRFAAGDRLVSLRPLRCGSASVEKFGGEPRSRLSDHFGVDVFVEL